MNDWSQNPEMASDELVIIGLVQVVGKRRAFKIFDEAGDELGAVESALLDPGAAPIELALVAAGFVAHVEEGREGHVVGGERLGFIFEFKVPQDGVGVGENGSNLEPLGNLCEKRETTTLAPRNFDSALD